MFVKLFFELATIYDKVKHGKNRVMFQNWFFKDKKRQLAG